MTEPALRIDIVSDIMCPWCIIGFLQLERAIADAGLTPEIHWHPFELNPQMPAGGQDMRAHLAEKYGTTPEDSIATRDRLAELGESLGFTFNYGENLRMWNSFLAHQLIEFADRHGAQQNLKLALFKAHFTDNRNVCDIDTLADIAAENGLSRDAALAALTSGEHAETVRTMQAFWVERGITGVPSMVFDSQHLLVGARGIDGYRLVLSQPRPNR